MRDGHSKVSVVRTHLTGINNAYDRWKERKVLFASTWHEEVEDSEEIAKSSESADFAQFARFD